ncbi:diguanylate cyclase [Allohahella marinimesophila]|uniref:diguanylate cyclase n=1 Tax=Allohahella marinimesophila TaxID=1054972 RepID=A0ABP7PFV2_9GAMM
MVKLNRSVAQLAVSESRALGLGVFPACCAVLLGLVLWSAPGHAQAADFVFSPAMTQHSLSSSTEVLVDSSKALDFSQVQQQPESRWSPVLSETPSFGFTGDTYWARFTISNPTSEPQQLLLEVGYALLDTVKLYQPQGDGEVLVQEAGDGIPYRDRIMDHRDLLFPLALPAAASQQFYLEIESTSAMQFPLQLWQVIEFYEDDQYHIFWHGLYYGIVFVMVLYNLFLYARIRDRVYLYYVLYISSFSVVQLTLSGFAYQLLWPGAVAWNSAAVVVVGSSVVLFACVFVQRALKLGEGFPLLKRYLDVIASLATVCLVFGLFAPYGLMIKFATALIIVTCASILLISYYVWLQSKRRYAALFVLAWTMFLFGVLCLSLNKFGLLPRNFITEYAAQFGSALEIIILSYALAERLYDAHRQSYQAELKARTANETLLEEQQRHSMLLGVTVRERTEALEQALKQVKSLNVELRELSTTDTLTGLKNRRHMDDVLQREFLRASRNKSELSLIMFDIDHFKQINDSAGHLAGDQCLQALASAIMPLLRRPPDEICRYGGEEFLIILPETSCEGATTVAEKIRQTVGALSIQTDAGPQSLTISLGVSCFRQGKTSIVSEMLQQADDALYQAKAGGRDQTRVAEGSV